MKLVRETLLNPIALFENKNGASFSVSIDCKIAVEHIVLFEVTSTSNEHTKLTIECLLSNANAEIYEDIDLEDEIVKLLHIKEKGKETLFAGYIECVEITFRNNSHYIIIKAVSASKKLAGKENKRSFQDLNKTYTNIVQSVLDDNNAMAVFSVDKDMKIPFPIIQYEETDWDFIKRIASHFNVSVFPESILGDCNVYFGMKKSKYNYDFSGESYRVGISEQFYKLGGEYLGLSKQQFLTYKVKSDLINAEVGDTGIIKGQSFRICEKKIYFDGSKLTFYYLLADEIYTTQKNVYNDKLAGVSIHGTVLETSAETLKLHLEIDGEQDKATAYSYKWVPETGNLMYLTPQIGTNVSLYFYNSSEGSGEVINCVRTNGGAVCPQMSDPSMRQLKTEYGNQMLLYPEVTGLVSGDASENQSFITVDDAEGIVINSHKGIFLSAKEKICLKAPTISFDTPERTTVSKVDFAVAMAEDGSISSIDVVNTPSFIVVDMGSFYTNTNTAIMSGSEGTPMPKIDDAPKEGEFDWGKLILGVAAGLAVVAVAVILAPVAIAGAVAVAGCVAVGGLAASNIMSGNVNEWYEFGLVAVVGCVVGAIGAVVYPLVATGLSTALGTTALSKTAVAVVAGIGAGAVTGSTCGFLGSIGNQLVLTHQVDLGSAGRSALTGAITGGVFGGVFGGITGGNPPTWPQTVTGGALGGLGSSLINQTVNALIFDEKFSTDKLVADTVMGVGIAVFSKSANQVVSRFKESQINIDKMTPQQKANFENKIRSEQPKDAPDKLKIPDNATVKSAHMKNGYEQVSFKWSVNNSDGSLSKFEVRWHTTTPGSPNSQTPNWVMSEEITSPTMNGSRTIFYNPDGPTVSGSQWFPAIAANRIGTATAEQKALLENGHWKDTSYLPIVPESVISSISNVQGVPVLGLQDGVVRSLPEVLGEDEPQ